MKKGIIAALAVILALGTVACGTDSANNTGAQDRDYGVFLSITEDLESLEDYQTVVIDAQYFSKEDIDEFRSGGHKVYSYINVGSLENFRDYYQNYSDLALGEYAAMGADIYLLEYTRDEDLIEPFSSDR